MKGDSYNLFKIFFLLFQEGSDMFGNNSSLCLIENTRIYYDYHSLLSTTFSGQQCVTI